MHGMECHMVSTSSFRAPRFALLIGIIVTVLLAGCGGSKSTATPAAAGPAAGNASTGGSTSAPTFSAAKGCKHVAFLSPDTTAGGRWEAYDHPLTEASVKAALPGVTFDAVNAQNSTDTQLTQASSELTK